METTKQKSSLLSSFRCAFCGIWACIRQERNMKIHLFMALCATVFGLALHISRMEWLVCLIFFALVMGAELVNTAVEAVVDLASPQRHPLAKLAKDTSAGAVLVCAIFAAIAGGIIFVPKLIALFT